MHTTKNIFLKYIYYAFTILVSVFFLFVIVVKFNFMGFLLNVENKTFDLRQNIIAKHKKVDENIVILSIDDASYEYLLERYGEWPIPRDIYADLIDYLEAQKPAVIAFDLMFVKSIKSTSNSDSILTEAIARNKNVFTSINFDNQPADLRKPVDLPDYLKVNVVNDSNINLNNPYIHFSNCRAILSSIIASTSNIGHINLVREDDGIARSVPVFASYKNDLYPHLALKVALYYLQKKEGLNFEKFNIDKNKNLVIGERKIPLDLRGATTLNWYGPSGRNENSNTFVYVPFYRALKSMEQLEQGQKTDLDAQFFKDKIVYIGTSAMSLYDIKSTPTEKYLPGVELHTTFVNNVLDNNFIKKINIRIDFLISLALSLFVGLLVLRINSALASTVTAVFVVIVYLYFSTFVMQHYNLWIGTVMPIISIVFTFTIVYVIKYLLKSRDFEYTYKLATTDGLTELYNHRYFQEQMILNIETSKRYETNFSIVLVDIDFFKKFNDEYGHQAGDAVLKQVAQTLKKSVRTTDIVCRYGGEEMAIILSKTSHAEAVLTAQKICDAVAGKPYKLGNDLEKHVTISLGVATYPEHGKSASKLIEYADKKLYRAKEAGRNRVGL